MEIGGGKIKRQMLLSMLIVCCFILIGLSTVSAEDATGNNITNVTVDPVSGYAGQTVNLTANVTSNGSAVTSGLVKFTVNNVAAGNAYVNSSGIATLSWLIPSHWALGIYAITADFNGTGTDYANSTNSSNLNVNAPVMKAYWMRWDDVAADPAALRSQGITDIFFLTRGVNGASHENELLWAINTYKPYGINVHAWIVCFKNNNCFVNPSGYYCYTNAIYVKTTRRWGLKAIPYYKKVRVGKYKVGKRWKSIYKYVLKYKYRKGWIYTPIYRYETVSGYDTSFTNALANYISYITNTYNIDGVHLDYVRYSGVASSGNAAWQQPGGSEAAVNTVTGFVEKVYNSILSSNKPTIKLSAAVMPEGYANPSIYAQDYGRLSKYLDFIVPMTYEGNYNADNAWITRMTSYIVSEMGSKGKCIPVYAGLTTYWSDSNTRALYDWELQADVNAAKLGGAAGYALFRYGFGSTYAPIWA